MRRSERGWGSGAPGPSPASKRHRLHESPFDYDVDRPPLIRAATPRCVELPSEIEARQAGAQQHAAASAAVSNVAVCTQPDRSGVASAAALVAAVSGWRRPSHLCRCPAVLGPGYVYHGQVPSASLAFLFFVSCPGHAELVMAQGNQLREFAGWPGCQGRSATLSFGLSTSVSRRGFVECLAVLPAYFHCRRDCGITCRGEGAPRSMLLD